MPNIEKSFLYEHYRKSNYNELVFTIGKRKKKIKNKHEKLTHEFKNQFRSRKKEFKRYYVRRWFISLLSVTPKKGRVIKYTKYIFYAFKKLNKFYGSLFRFFSIVERNLHILFDTFKKKIAGKNLMIPIGLDPLKRINAMTKLIITSLKLRKEKSFKGRLVNELNDIVWKRGITINKRLNYMKQLKSILINIRFLNEKYL